MLVLASCKATPREVSSDCASCHAEEARAWAGSHHALGQRATSSVPDGDLDAFAVRSGVLTWREPDGGTARGAIRYTIGVEPLVQVAVELPGGRVQVPPIAFTSDGGWRRVPTPLNGAIADWRQPSFNWNGSCAPCHATGFIVGGEALRSSWQALNVTCAACHGAADGHLSWLRAERPANVASHGFTQSLRSATTFVFVDGGHLAQPTSVATQEDRQADTCGACHSRRRPLRDDGRLEGPALERYEPTLLEPGLFTASGGVLDEVYEVTSFSQSAMHEAGVRCSDCHEPHGAKLRAPGDEVCARCHREPHDAREGTCVGCHMPTRTFMGAQVRHDHFIRREVDASRENPLSRASRGGDASSVDPLLRYGAASALSRLPPEERLRRGTRLLSDPVLAVRVKAGRALLGVSPLSPALRAEVETAERANAFRGDAWLNLAALAQAAGDVKEAEVRLRRGLELDPYFAPLTINLADLLRATGRDVEGIVLLETALRSPGPWTSPLAYALGLARWRQKDRAAALEAFRLAAQDGDERHVRALRMAETELGGR